MIRPDHAWLFFTVVLSLALAMSTPPQRKATAFGSIWEQHATQQ
jgi:hypothetical protein